VRWQVRVSLLNLIATHLRDPLVHVGKLVLKGLLELLSGKPHRIALLPVCEAVVKNLAHIPQELFLVIILLAVHLDLDRAKIHRSLDLFEVVWNTVFNWLDGISEWTNKSGPEAYVKS
jgi:hypothetical protein